MTWTLVMAVWAALFAGIALMMSRDLLRAILGSMILGSGVNLIIFVAGRVGLTGPAIVPYGQQALAEGAANPLPQALVLTAIVIGLALVCFAFVLIYGIAATVGTADSTRLRVAEPEPDHPVYPPLPDPDDRLAPSAAPGADRPLAAEAPR
ncbi:MAG: NADH-quinone oxidoreductase subunit K [Rhodobacteraceae bacterium]|jgi:multicomponent Na+:H+ antiporter subunit C|nr:NADH-quinone oxidoreductase subunit K [Paracoccaceae bacterium]